MGVYGSKAQLNYDEIASNRKNLERKKDSFNDFSPIFKNYFPIPHGKYNAINNAQNRLTLDSDNQVVLPSIELPRSNSFTSSKHGYINYLSKHDAYIKYLQTNDKLNKSQSDIDNSEKSDLEDISSDYLLINTFKNTADSKLRTDYIAKLIVKKIWNPEIEVKKFNTIFLFDWDDTLLCSTAISEEFEKISEEAFNKKYSEILNKLDIVVEGILKKAISLGDVYIITNAVPGWVEYTSKRLYKRTYKYVRMLKVISARGAFGDKYPESKMWKWYTFETIIAHYNTNLVTNIISFGDSIIELEAGHHMFSKCPKGFLKTVKFQEKPNQDLLYEQLNFVLEKFDEIYSSAENLSITTDVKKTVK